MLFLLLGVPYGCGTLCYVAMAQVPVASEDNRNKYWLNSRGMWLGYLTTVAILHCLILSIPFLSTPQAWTLTHVIHNVVS